MSTEKAGDVDQQGSGNDEPAGTSLRQIYGPRTRLALAALAIVLLGLIAWQLLSDPSHASRWYIGQLHP